MNVLNPQVMSVCYFMKGPSIIRWKTGMGQTVFIQKKMTAKTNILILKTNFWVLVASLPHQEIMWGEMSSLKICLLSYSLLSLRNEYTEFQIIRSPKKKKVCWLDGYKATLISLHCEANLFQDTFLAFKPRRRHPASKLFAPLSRPTFSTNSNL